MSIENNFPVAALGPYAYRESRRRQFYRPIYSIHKWWARRPGSTFRTIALALFSGEDSAEKILSDRRGDTHSKYFNTLNLSDKIILDPFMGGGTTIVELNRLKAKTIGVDLNPIAWWMVRNELTLPTATEFKNAFKELKKTIGKEILNYYRSKCPNKDCGATADVMYFFWHRKAACPSCSADMPLIKHYMVGKDKRDSKIVHILCPNCREIFETTETTNKHVTCSFCNNKVIPKILR
ncbi:MAG: DNA methyltransferase [Candidatus Odinarchaeota archaeon]